MFYAVRLLFFLYGCLALVAAIAVIAVIVSFIGKKETRERKVLHGHCPNCLQNYLYYSTIVSPFTS